MHRYTSFLLSSHSDIKWKITHLYRAAQYITLTYSLFNASAKPLIFKYMKQRPLKTTMVISRCVSHDGCRVYQYRHFVLIFICNEQLAFCVGYSVYKTCTVSKTAHISPRWKPMKFIISSLRNCSIDMYLSDTRFKNGL